jgi:hypothetical protein
VLDVLRGWAETQRIKYQDEIDARNQRDWDEFGEAEARQQSIWDAREFSRGEN